MDPNFKKRKLAEKCAIGFAAGLFSLSTVASTGWFSKSIEVKTNGEKTATFATNKKLQNATDSSETLFDIAISLHNSPAGDDDASIDGGDDQEIYEEIIDYFADAVCEQTNGSHRLRKVRFFRNNQRQSQSDIIWGESEWPRAVPSGFGALGGHIWFGDIFPNGNGPENDFDMLSNTKAAGYTLGHEWGHYAYGLFDEYQGNDPNVSRASSPQVTDIVTSPSIMNSQWQAVSDDPSWLNHSTSDNIGDVARTAQGRVYGKSGWDVLVQDVSEDPRSGELTAQPNRTRYTSLINAAPADPNWVEEELPGAQTSCRSELEVIWVEGNTDIQVVIDRSGSMSGSPIANAKQAASLLVDATEEGNTAMGIVSFSGRTSVRQESPIQSIPSPDTGVKSQIKAAIDNIRAGGSTALYTASQFALDNLINYQTTSNSGAAGVVFLLADGDNNSGFISQESVIANYQSADIPIFSFGYGSASPTGPLLTLANSTGGNYFSSPTTLSEITDAFLQANAIATNTQNLLDARETLAVGSSTNFALEIDAGLERISAFLSFNAQETDLNIKLFNAAGIEVTETMLECTNLFSGTSCTLIADSAALLASSPGRWSIEATNVGAFDINLDVNAIASASDQGTFATSVSSASGNAVQYPAPFILTATTVKTYLVTNLNVVAKVTDPFANVIDLPMYDDGTNGDAIADDGIYSTIFPYSVNGIHQVEVEVNNNNAAAEFTITGSLTANLDGTQPILDPLPIITDNFNRIAKSSIVVSDIPFSDGDDAAGTANQINPNNVGINGVIDEAGDRDFYVANNLDISAPVVVRVSNLSSGMSPQLRIFGADGSTQILSDLNLTTNPSATGYLYADLADDNLEETMFFEVSHVDSSQSTGGYQISLGNALNTDVPPNANPEAQNDSASVFVGETVQLNVLENDTDADGDTIVVDSVSTTQTFGQVTIIDSATGLMAYDPSTGFDDLPAGDATTDSFTYIIADGKGGFAQGTVTVEVRANANPEAVDDNVTTDELTDLTIIVLENDSDSDGHTFTVTSTDESGLTGSLTDNGDGSFTYSPNAQFTVLKANETDTDSFSYEITDELGGIDSATVTITVQGVNQAPIAENDTASVTESATVELSVLANDSDADNDTLSIDAVNTSNTQGSVTINTNGTLTYSPNGQFNALNDGQSNTDTFTYTVSDGATTASATVTITVNGEGSATESSSSGGSLGVLWMLVLSLVAVVRRRNLHRKVSKS